MRGNNRKSIEKFRKKLSQFTTMNVIDGQAGLIMYTSLIFYSLTIDNILNIIVLLILAGVTISTLTGENGILTKASTSKEQTIVGEEKEAITLAYTTCKMDDFSNNVTSSRLQEELERNQKESQVSDLNEDLIVLFKETSHRYTIDQDGKIERIEDLTPEEQNKVIDMISDKLVITGGGEVKYLTNPNQVENQLTKINLESATTITKYGVKKSTYDYFIDNIGKVYTLKDRVCISDEAGSELNGKKIIDIIQYANVNIALDDEGKVYTWAEGGRGDNNNGELGDGTNESRSTPKCISEITGNELNGKKIKQIYFNNSAAMALDENGKIYVWGNNAVGQLGDGTTQNRNTPKCISDISGSELNGKNIKQIYGKGHTKIALDENGKVYTWGSNTFGELGDGTTQNRSTPKCISDITGSELNGRNIKEIVHESLTIIALDTAGKVYTWGYNSNGELGDGTTQDRNTPKCISDEAGSELNGRNIKEILHSAYGTILALDNTGKICTWGGNEYGQLGDGTNQERSTPKCISDITGSDLNNKNIIKIYISKKTTMALDDEGKVYTWGYNSNGELGDGTTENKNIPKCISDIQNSSLNNIYIKEINIYEDNNASIISLDNNGKVYVWGDNAYGQLGDGTTEDKTDPICISEDRNNILYDKNIRKVYSLSYSNYYYITKDGEIFNYRYSAGLG